MKKAIIGIWFLILLLGFESVFADGTCGTNVKYTINGNTITFSKEDSGSDAEWSEDCGSVFRDDSAITIVKVSDPIRVTDAAFMFQGFEYVQAMYLSKLDVSEVTDMSLMFSLNGSLKTLDVSNWDTSKVTDMSQVFWYCEGLETLDLSSWDTSNVTDMYQMFQE